jgi:glycosyltransferase involved in cell wall biosynthesis
LKVLFITNIPSPYRVDFFNEFGKYCDLTVLFEREASDERDKSWSDYKFVNFNGIILNGKITDTDKAFCPQVLKYLKRGLFEHTIIANIATPTGMFAIQCMKMKRMPYIIEGDGAFAKNTKGLKEIIKKYLLTGAKAYFSTSKSHDEYYLTYGAIKENIYRYPFTSIKKADILLHQTTYQEKIKLRNELLINEEKVVLSVGQFVHRKGYDVLLQACNTIDKSVGVYIIGGEPTNEYKATKFNMDLTNVYFLGFKSRSELKKYYKVADVFVLPTREDIWGLVINEAMANGLPTITTDKCVAGLELIVNNANGFIIPSNNSKSLSDKINILLTDDDLRKEMGQSNLHKISKYTVEYMAKVHYDVLKEIEY